MIIIKGTINIAHTPEGHKNGKGDSSVIVEQIADTRRTADTAQLPVITHTIAQRTHGEIKTLITHLLTEREKNSKYTTNVHFTIIVVCAQPDHPHNENGSSFYAQICSWCKEMIMSSIHTLKNIK